MSYQNIIIRNPEILRGKPIIKGSRISVELILKKLSEGMTFNQLIDIYPSLTTDKILACLEYASKIISNDDLLVS
jgi:uncharacterized protein (DUF433 family)